MSGTDIHELFNPRSIAVVGAGSDPSSMGGRALLALLDHGYAGRIYPVNPRRDTLHGLTCYASIDDIPDAVDLVLVLISPTKTADVLRQAGEKGARFAVLLNAGFAEIGGDGILLQEELLGIAQRCGMRLVGPNCGGLINVRDDIPLGFLPAFALRGYERGPMGIVAQSGGVLTNLLNKAHDRRYGLSFGSSTGNEPDLSVVDFIEHLLEDEGTKSICVYAESVRDAPRFVAACRRAAQLGKPMVLLKAGRSTAGQETAASHTGALATSYRVLAGVAARYGVHLVDDMDDLLDIGWYLANENLDAPAPGKVVAVATSGGTAVMTADALDGAGIELPQPTPRTLTKIRASLPAFGISRNPIDITAQYLNEPDLFGNMLRTLEVASEYDAIVVSLAMITTGYADRFAADIESFRQSSSLPLVVAWTGGSLAAAGITSLRSRGIPVFTRLQTCAAALRARASFAAARQRLTVAAPPVTRSVVAEPVELPLTEFQAMQLLGRSGVTFAPARLAHTAQEAVAAAAELGYPVVAKLSSTRVTHKSDVGGVRVGLRSAEDVRLAYEALDAVAGELGIRDDASGTEVLVQAMVRDGVEALVGLRRDPTFGWVVVVGSGGVLTEAVDDVAVSPVPVDREEAERMVDSLILRRLLGGFRGAAPGDRRSLVDVVVALSAAADGLPAQVSSVEVNPVLVTAAGAFGADALVVGG